MEGPFPTIALLSLPKMVEAMEPHIHQAPDNNLLMPEVEGEGEEEEDLIREITLIEIPGILIPRPIGEGEEVHMNLTIPNLLIIRVLCTTKERVFLLTEGMLVVMEEEEVMMDTEEGEDIDQTTGIETLEVPICILPDEHKITFRTYVSFSKPTFVFS